MTKRAPLLISDTGGGHRSAANAITAALDEIKAPSRSSTRIEDVAAHCAFPLTQLGLGYSMALRYAPPSTARSTTPPTDAGATARWCASASRSIASACATSSSVTGPTSSFRSIRCSITPRCARATTRTCNTFRSSPSSPISARFTSRGSSRRRRGRRSGPRSLQRALSRGVPPADCTCSGIRSIRSSTTSPEAKPNCARSSGLAGRQNAGRHADGRRRRRRQAASDALALAKAGLSIELVVVCGRNEPLAPATQRDLARSLPTRCTSSVSPIRFPSIFARSTCSLPRPAPGTLAEANAAQLPVIVYDYVPGQERGNVDFVRHNGLGLIALQRRGAVVRAVQTLIRAPDRLEDDSPQSRVVAPRRSSRRIAALIAQIADTGTIPSQDDMPARALAVAASL
jgi:1,2-diacylglycerol 3-beta-galactosyltransferase